MRYGIAILLLFTAFSPLVFSDTIRVPQDAATIQAGVDMASTGDVVLVAAGTYIGEGNRNINFNGKAITVRSEAGPDYTILDCDGGDWMNPHGGFVFNSGETSSSIVEGFTITRADQGVPGSAIGCLGSSPYIVDCRISNNFGGPASGGGVQLSYSGATFEDCWITDNSAYADGGVSIWGGDSVPVFRRCLFARNSGQGGGAIGIGQSGLLLDQCTLVDNYSYGSYAAVFLSGECPVEITNTIIAFNDDIPIDSWDYKVDSVTFECCDLYGNSGGDWTDSIMHFLGVDGNISADPLFCDMERDFYQLEEGSPCIGSSCGTMGAFLTPGCPITDCDPDSCYTCGGLQAGIRVRNTFQIHQDKFSIARWLSFDVANKEPWINVNGWRIKLCGFDFLASRQKDEQTVGVYAAGGDIPVFSWLTVDVDYWLEQWNTVRLSNINWVRDADSTVQAAPSFGWAIANPAGGSRGELTHKVTLFNDEESSDLTFSNIMVKLDNNGAPVEDLLSIVDFTDTISNVTISPGDSSSIELAEAVIPGDADGSGAVDIDDIMYLVAYIFLGGPEPFPYYVGDANCNSQIDIDDVMYIVAYVFLGGPDPCETPQNRSAAHIYGRFEVSYSGHPTIVINYFDHPVE